MKDFLRPSLSTLLVLIFFFILLALGLVAEVFDTQITEVDMAQVYANPVPVGELQHLRTLKLTNKNGEFLLQNTHPDGDLQGPWQILTPQPLKVKSDVIAKIIDALNVLKVRNFHKLEPINVTNFSLDNPTLTLLFTNTFNKTYELKLGLINPIDNSAYLSLSTQNQIYQIEPLQIPLDAFDLTQLIDSKVISFNPETLLTFEVAGSKNPVLKLTKKEDRWEDPAGSSVGPEKVKALLERIQNIKSYTVLEGLSEDQNATLRKAMVTPAQTIKLVSTAGVRTYTFYEIKEKLPGLDEPKGPAYFLTTEDKRSIILIDPGELRFLEIGLKDLR
ncbi:MAG TPA: DUF4340 domain-containing protein [Bacteriovoracaceae bacterium]|nr:DUF4340 domain-containing protein [Bacteriovoracaceae bacterium]